MDDSEIRRRIEELVEEEHRLWTSEAEGGAASDRDRLEKVRVTLDQCWDLLRQRRALEEFGRDPDAAGVRDPDTVEHYQQ